MYRYAQIIVETGTVVGDSHLSGEVNRPNLIPIPDGFDLTNKKYINGEWIAYEPPEPDPVEPEATLADVEKALKEAINNAD